MTHSATNKPTITNSGKATKHSGLEPKASPKNEFLKSFSSGKLRKNAKKKIQKLLDCADSLVLKTQSMGLDDCWNANNPIQFDKANFWKWFEKEYREMVIFLTVHDGVLVKAEFCDCIYHFSNDIVMTFSLDETQPEKPAFNLVEECHVSDPDDFSEKTYICVGHFDGLELEDVLMVQACSEEEAAHKYKKHWTIFDAGMDLDTREFYIDFCVLVECLERKLLM